MTTSQRLARSKYRARTAPNRELVCQVCGAQLAYNGRGPRPKFCSDHAPDAHNYGDCKYCGKALMQGHLYPHYCDQACYLADFRVYRKVTG